MVTVIIAGLNRTTLMLMEFLVKSLQPNQTILSKIVWNLCSNAKDGPSFNTVTNASDLDSSIKQLFESEGILCSVPSYTATAVLGISGLEAPFPVCSSCGGCGLRLKIFFAYMEPKTITAPISCSMLSG